MYFADTDPRPAGMKTKIRKKAERVSKADIDIGEIIERIMKSMLPMIREMIATAIPGSSTTPAKALSEQKPKRGDDSGAGSAAPRCAPSANADTRQPGQGAAHRTDK